MLARFGGLASDSMGPLRHAFTLVGWRGARLRFHSLDEPPWAGTQPKEQWRMKTTSSELVMGQLVSQPADLLAVPSYEDDSTHPILATIDRALAGVLQRAMADEDMGGKKGQTLVLHTHGKLAATKVILVGMGKRPEVNEDGIRRYGGTVARVADKVRARALAVAVPESKLDASTALAAAAEGTLLGLYRFDRYVTKDRQETRLESLTLLGPKDVERGVLERSERLCQGVCLARDLVNEPASTLTPVALAAHAERAAAAAGISYSHLGPKEMAKERMELLLAVSRASAEEPRVVRLEYRPTDPAQRKVVLVGKGLTFDSGGLDIKTAEGMLDMKVDMSGAAAVLGAMVSLASQQSRAHVVGYLGCAENMVGGRAYKPGDIIKSRSGLTVEIGNTDAEGRLVLADVLSYAQDAEKPDEVIDLATLTGASMIALGPNMAGLFSNHEELARRLTKASDDAGEDCWRMPLSEPLKEMLKSPVADLKNVGQRYGGAITAALFLREFIKDGVAWAHLDIAGPATAEKERDYVPKGGTGFGVRTLVRYLADLG
jgi:leucyl aminopeptidase